MNEDLWLTNYQLFRVIDSVAREYCKAAERYSDFSSAHEGYAIILEELDELWTAVKESNVKEATKEAVQVAAMAVRFIIDSKNFRRS
jgi:spore coat protein CotH